MTLTIQITPDLESRLRAEAARQGVDPAEFVSHAVRERLQQPRQPDPPHLSADETALLREINEGLAPGQWERYHELLERRRAELLTSEEQAELVQLSDQLEEFNARRMEHLAELARLRQVSLRRLMDQLGIQPPPYA